MSRVTEESLDDGERRLIRQSSRRARVTPKAVRITFTASRAAFLFFCGLAAVLAPEPWMRALPAILIVVAAYTVGWFDGRKSLALDLLGARRDDRGTRPAPRSGDELEDG